MVNNYKNGAFKGFCYIEYEEPASVVQALSYHEKEFRGRKIHVDVDDGDAKASFKIKPSESKKYNNEYTEVLDKILGKKKRRDGE